MNSLILRTATGFLMAMLALFSVYLFLRGHDKPGGGFIGGLTAAAALVLYAFAFDVSRVWAILRVNSLALTGAGLLMAAASGIPALFMDRAYLAALWGEVTIPGVGEIHLGTPLLFDVGVYLVVIGVSCAILLTMAEEQGE
jgi:multicomponent Na+:H+ antiporter subunit B